MTSRSTFEHRLDDWIADGPTDAPAQVLDAVLAAVPTTPQRRRGWRSRFPLSPLIGFSQAFAGLVIAIGLAAALFLVLRPAPGGIGSVGSPSPGASASPDAVAPPAPASVAPAVAASPTPAVSAVVIGACDPTTLSAKITLWDGAAGNRIAHVELTNGGSTCELPTMAKPQLVDGNGSVLIDGAAPTASGTITIAAGHKFRTLVDVANYCGPDPAAPVSVAFALADGHRIVATPFSPTDATVPPCNGAPGSAGDIQMHPWAP
jgi:hypothetical protein